ncbi:PepSY-associated TM helix domain-containing protein [Propionivibrio soli]|uniref:PepSY-associated TM helix domain-containing protein n=1 Tax=Propionivibrio soli TaxID=2976531 RepID=UPI0021E72791|nr:PepSY-associated TM helix domain-containing protein [Propionivibrio soli]
MRPLFVLLHRYAGLFMVPFLFVTGLTGAIISWDHELDDLLNPHLMEAPARGPHRSSLALAREIEARDSRVRVTFLPLSAEPGESLHFGVEPRIDPRTGQFFTPGYNQVFVDPANGTELGRREWGAVWPITRETLVSFLYKLHYSLHISPFAGSDRWGIWLLGIVAVVWTVDCFTGVFLTFPASRRRPGSEPPQRSWWQRWQTSWRVRRGTGTYKLNYDLHRAGSLWTWVLLFVLAFTAFSLNLYREAFYPLMSMVSQVTPTPFDTREPADFLHPREAKVGYGEIVALAGAEAARRQWDEPPGSVFYSTAYGVYSVQFFHPGGDHGAAGVGPARLFFDGEDGRLLGERLPWQGTAADVFVQAQFPVHSGRILGLPGRILISAMGLVVAMLSVTGAYVWWRKRRSRVLRDEALKPEWSRRAMQR